MSSRKQLRVGGSSAALEAAQLPICFHGAGAGKPVDGIPGLS